MASYFSTDADDLDDGLGLDNWNVDRELDIVERANYQAVDRERAWAAPYRSQRSADEHLVAPINRQYGFGALGAAFGGIERFSEEEEKHHGMLARPIANASRNIKFDMLQPHFERPLQEAALFFGVCTTLLKKICRKNGIANWPFRKICGLRKSITSMEKQVQYFDGDRKKAYAEQLRKLEVELEAYKRIGKAPTPEFEWLMHEEAAATMAAAASDNPDDEFAARSQLKAASDAGEDENEDKRGVRDIVDEGDALRTTADGGEPRTAERVSPLLQLQLQTSESSGDKRGVNRSSSGGRNRAVQGMEADSIQRHRQGGRLSDLGGRLEHLHRDQVFSRSSSLVDRTSVHAYQQQGEHEQQYGLYQQPRDRHQQLQQQQQQQSEHYFLRQQHRPNLHHIHDRQREQSHLHNLSTISLHQRSLPSIGALFYQQNSDRSGRPDASRDRRGEFYDQRNAYQ